MKNYFTRHLSVLLAALLQVFPLLRVAVPVAQSIGLPNLACVLPWAAGTVTLLSSVHAVSGATAPTMVISPSTATQGVLYTGTASFTGTYATEINAMKITNTCLGTFQIFPGLTYSYSGSGTTATISGTPTASNTNFTFKVTCYQFSGCSGENGTVTSPVFSIAQGAAMAPSFTTLPTNPVALIGQTPSFFGVASGTPTPSYFWKKSSTVFSLSNTCTLTNIQLTNAGQYTLTASNASGTVFASCVVSVIQPPGTNFTTANYTNYAIAGTNLTLSTIISNTALATSSYVWTYPGSGGPITNQSISLLASPTNSGIFSILYNSANGTNIYAKITNNTDWQFGYAPAISIQPGNVTTNNGSNAVFNLTLQGSTYPTLLLYNSNNAVVASSYASTLNPLNSTDTNAASITLAGVNSSSSGQYTIVVTNNWGATTSSLVSLTVISPPVITTNPAATATTYAGKNLALSVAATGDAPLFYQWQKGGTNTANGGNLSGSTSNTLSLTPAALTNSGSYRVVVSNSSGIATSAVSAVSIVAVPNLNYSIASNKITLTGSNGIPIVTYAIESTTNLALGPWTTLISRPMPVSGLINFTDTNPVLGSSLRFYRVRIP